MSAANLHDLRAELEQVASQPFKGARTLPREAYTSADFLRIELKSIFERDWICVGRADEVARVGDFFVVDLLGRPVIVCRCDRDRIVALSNVCRHRNMQLLAGRGNIQRIVCPYHAWSYRLTGRFIGAPHAWDNLDAAICSLPQYRLEIWNGWIYVTLGEVPTPLQAQLTRLGRIIGPYGIDEYETVFADEEVWDTNWKCLAENFMESYHVFRVHRNTLEPVIPTRNVKLEDGGELFNCHYNYRNEPVDAIGPARRILTDEQRRTHILYCVYPSHLVALSPDRAFWMTLQPRGVDQVSIRWGVLAAPGTIDSGDGGEDLRRSLRASFERVNGEDRFIVERVFRSLSSRSGVQGFLMPLEKPVWEFNKYICGRVLSQNWDM